MIPSVRHLRPLLISLVALLLTAGIAFAGKPTSAPAGLAIAEQASGKTVPAADEGDEGDEAPDLDENAEAESDGSGHCLVDPTTASEEVLAALNHGAIVCWAAHQATPDGYANHGAFVSEWAHKNHGEDASAKGATKAAEKADRSGGPGKANQP